MLDCNKGLQVRSQRISYSMCRGMDDCSARELAASRVCVCVWFTPSDPQT